MKLEDPITDLGWKCVPWLVHMNWKRKPFTCQVGYLVPKIEAMTAKIWIGRCPQNVVNEKARPTMKYIIDKDRVKTQVGRLRFSSRH